MAANHRFPRAKWMTRKRTSRYNENVLHFNYSGSSTGTQISQNSEKCTFKIEVFYCM